MFIAETVHLLLWIFPRYILSSSKLLRSGLLTQSAIHLQANKGAHFYFLGLPLLSYVAHYLLLILFMIGLWAFKNWFFIIIPCLWISREYQDWLIMYEVVNNLEDFLQQFCPCFIFMGQVGSWREETKGWFFQLKHNGLRSVSVVWVFHRNGNEHSTHYGESAHRSQS